MKKIIISLLIIGSLTTGSVFAYNKNMELNTEEYINLVNTGISQLNSEIELPIKTIMKIQTIEKAYTYSMHDFLHNKKVSEDIIETVYREVLRRYPESLFTINKIEIRLY